MDKRFTVEDFGRVTESFHAQFRPLLRNPVMLFKTLLVIAGVAQVAADGGQTRSATAALPVSGIPDGSQEEFVRDGLFPFDPLVAKARYRKDGKVVGERLFYKEKRLAQETPMRDGVRHGLMRQWWSSGELFSEVPYVDGLIDGRARFWNAKGELLGESTLRKGTGCLRRFQNLDVRSWDSEECYVNGKIEGWQREWVQYEGCIGRGVALMSYRDNQLHGWSYTFDEDGTSLGSSHFQNGRTHGIASHWDRDGKLRAGSPAYYLRGEMVSSEKYLEAAQSDPKLIDYTRPPPAPAEFIPRSPK
jgi:antitoxin component YwqK of YwqJK toxin-antitoxin module